MRCQVCHKENQKTVNHSGLQVCRSCATAFDNIDIQTYGHAVVIYSFDEPLLKEEKKEKIPLPEACSMLFL